MDTKKSLAPISINEKKRRITYGIGVAFTGLIILMTLALLALSLTMKTNEVKDITYIQQ